MAADDVRTDVDVRGLDADALAGSCLSGDVGVWLDKLSSEIEFDDATDVEHDIAWLVDVYQSIEQGAGCVLVAAEVRHMIHHAAASANGIAAIALSTRESQLARLEGPYLSLMHLAVVIHLVNAPPIFLHG